MRPYAARLSGHRFALWMLCGLAAQAWAADGGKLPSSGGVQSTPPMPGATELWFDFDIPAQPLINALNKFAAISGRAALFPGTLVAARYSSRVLGRYTAKAALHRLLEGSGLDVEEVSAGRLAALILKPAEPQARPAAEAERSNMYSLGGYENLVQARIWEAVCADPRTAVGTYRSLLRFQVDAAGRVRQPRLLGSTGDGRRDAALLEAVRRVHLDRSPPPEMAQPVTMLILPEQADGPVCAAGRSQP